MNRFLTPIGQVTISYLSSLGAFTRLTWETICSIGKFHLGRTLHQASLLGVNSLIIVLTISLFTGILSCKTKEEARGNHPPGLTF